MHLDLTDADTLALLNLLVETIEADRYPMSPLFRRLQDQDGWVRAAQTFGIRAPHSTRCRIYGESGLKCVVEGSIQSTR